MAGENLDNTTAMRLGNSLTGGLQHRCAVLSIATGDFSGLDVGALASNVFSAIVDNDLLP